MDEDVDMLAVEMRSTRRCTMSTRGAQSIMHQERKECLNNSVYIYISLALVKHSTDIIMIIIVLVSCYYL